jgi:hypothetical protein
LRFGGECSGFSVNRFLRNMRRISRRGLRLMSLQSRCRCRCNRYVVIASRGLELSGNIRTPHWTRGLDVFPSPLPLSFLEAFAFSFLFGRHHNGVHVGDLGLPRHWLGGGRSKTDLFLSDEEVIEAKGMFGRDDATILGFVGEENRAQATLVPRGSVIVPSAAELGIPDRHGGEVGLPAASQFFIELEVLGDLAHVDRHMNRIFEVAY